jgi:hypothetical protein
MFKKFEFTERHVSLHNPHSELSIKVRKIMKTTTNSVSTIISFVLRAVAMAMAVAAIVLGILGTADTQTLVTLLSIGLFTLALDSLDRGPELE